MILLLCGTCVKADFHAATVDCVPRGSGTQDDLWWPAAATAVCRRCATLALTLTNIRLLALLDPLGESATSYLSDEGWLNESASGRIPSIARWNLTAIDGLLVSAG